MTAIEIAGPRSRTGDGGPVAQVAQCGDGHGDGVAAYDVAADHGRARDLALVPDAVHQLDRPGGGEFRGHHEAEQHRGGHRAHGGDVGEVLRGGLAADVVGGGPVAPEVPAFEEHVGGGDHPAVGRGHHGGVVSRADLHRGGRGEAGGQFPDEPELPQLAHSPLHIVVPSILGPRLCPGRVRCVFPVNTGVRYRAGLPAVRDDAITWRPPSHMILEAALEVPWYRRTS